LCRLDVGRTAAIKYNVGRGGLSARRRQRPFCDHVQNVEKNRPRRIYIAKISIFSFIKIAVSNFLNIFAIRFASFVDIYVYFMRGAQRISIIVSWPGGDVVFTKQVVKKLENWDYGSF
jgi:hypothetical protein